MAITRDSGEWGGREDFVGGVTNERIYTSDEPLSLEAVEALRESIRRDSSIEWGVRKETGPNNPKEYAERLKRKAETMYKYRFRFRGGGKRVENMNFKFHCFVADSDAMEHHLFEAKNKGLVVQAPMQAVIAENETHMYDSAMPIVKVFSSTSGFGVAKEYFSFFFLLNSNSKKMVKIKPLGFDNPSVGYQLSDWYFTAPGRFLTKEEIRKFFGHTSDTWKYYQRQSFISKRRLLAMVEVGDNKNRYDGELEEENRIRTIRMD